jgi:peptide deformylase
MGIFNMPMINPIITKKLGDYQTEEGCLSLEGVRSTTRYQEIEVEYFGASWKKQKQKYSGWIAEIIQHEFDHLEAIII